MTRLQILPPRRFLPSASPICSPCRQPLPPFRRRSRALLAALLSLFSGFSVVSAVSGVTAVGAVAAVAGLGLAARPAQAADALPTIDIDEVKVGQRGYGLSVFAGGEPQRFDVEVIGVMRNTIPDMNYILAKLSGRGLESSGVAAGMSGSPVFLDGRLAGAVSFGWPFSKEAVCGVTPIAAMRRLTTFATPVATSAPPPVPLADLLAGRVPKDLLARQMALLHPNHAGLPQGALSSIEWTSAGFGEQSRALLAQAFGPIATAGMSAGSLGAGGLTGGAGSGGAAAFAPSAGGGAALGRAGGTVPAPVAPHPDLVPGSAVAAVLVDGDLQLAAVGTVTDHLDDRILAFGHAFLGFGAIRVPMAAADVITVLSSQYSSFKIANLGATVGAFEQDRQAGIEGRLGAQASMVPLTLRISGPPGITSAATSGSGGPAAAAVTAAPGRLFHVRIADIPEMLPLLTGSTLAAGLESASFSSGPQDLNLTARFRLVGHDDLVVRQSFDGESAVSSMASYLVAVASYLEQNPLEQVRIQDVDVDIQQTPRQETATVAAAYADRAIVHPGDRLAIHVELQPYRGPRSRRTIQLQLPRDLPLGRYSLLVGDGPAADAARLTLAPVDPTTFAQAAALLRSLHSRRDLTLIGFRGSAGVAVAGEVLPMLPGSLRSLWAASPAPGATALRAAIVQERSETLPVPIDGLLRIDVEVRRRDAAPPVPDTTDRANADEGETSVQLYDSALPASGREGVQ